MTSNVVTPRALRRYRLNWPIVWLDILLLCALIVGTWWLLQIVMPWWAEQFNFWSDKTGLLANVHMDEIPPNWRLLPPFHVTAATIMPSETIWWFVALVCALLWAWTLRMNRERLPLIYFIRLLVLVQCSALAYFYLWSESLPTSSDQYLVDIFRQSAGFILLLPVLFGLALFPFALAWWVKYGAVITAMVFLFVSVPLQAACIAWALQTGSAMMMPVLYLFFGLLPQVMGLMGIYGFALSLLPSDDALSREDVLI